MTSVIRRSFFSVKIPVLSFSIDFRVISLKEVVGDKDGGEDKKEDGGPSHVFLKSVLVKKQPVAQTLLNQLQTKPLPSVMFPNIICSAA